MDVLTRLTSEHDTLRTLLERIQVAAGARDAAALAASLEAARPTLTDELDTHIVIEETEAFAPIAQTLGEEALAHYYQDHVEIRALRDELFAQLARGEMPYETSERLCKLILIHQQYEDQKLFPQGHEAAAAFGS